MLAALARTLCRIILICPHPLHGAKYHSLPGRRVVPAQGGEQDKIGHLPPGALPRGLCLCAPAAGGWAVCTALPTGSPVLPSPKSSSAFKHCCGWLGQSSRAAQVQALCGGISGPNYKHKCHSGSGFTPDILKGRISCCVQSLSWKDKPVFEFRGLTQPSWLSLLCHGAGTSHH